MRMLLLVDGSVFSNNASRHAASLAKAMGAELAAFHVIHGETGKPLSTESMERTKAVQARACFDEIERLAKDSGIDLEKKMAISRNITETIIQEAASGGYDLIVAGSHGLSGFRKLILGSVTEAVLRRKPCPVLVV